MNKRIFSDSRALESSHQLEITILTEHHEDVLWRETRDLRHYQLRNSKLQEAERLIGELHNNATSAKKRGLIVNIKREFEKFRVATMPDQPVTLEEMTLLPDNLLQALENFGEQNQKQMKETIQASTRLDGLVDRWSQILISFVTIVVVLGSLLLIKRIIRPTFALMRAAKRFGQGDFHTRTKAYRTDELGALCRTFNEMAEAICSLERDRQNFIAAVAHDLKNPLIMIGASAHRVRKKISPPR